MTNILGTFSFLVLLSWLPIAIVIAVTMWRGFRPRISSLLVPLVIGAVLGLALLYPLSEASLWVILGLVILIVAAVLAAFHRDHQYVFAALALIAGAHLAVPFGSDGPLQGDSTGGLWAMPMIDLWLIIGIPALILSLGFALIKRRGTA